MAYIACPSSGSPLRRAIASALLLPFVLLSMLAAGTMPVRGEQGVELVICLGDSLATITVPADEAPPGKAPKRRHVACPWNEAAQPALAATPVLPIIAPATLSPVTYPPAAAPRDIRARIRQVTNRGPPVAV